MHYERKSITLTQIQQGRAPASRPSLAGLVRSFAIPHDDPDYGHDEADAPSRADHRVEQRSFIYDDALAVLAFLGAGRGDRARAILTQLAKLQSDDGSLPFSVDTWLGCGADDSRRSGPPGRLA